MKAFLTVFCLSMLLCSARAAETRPVIELKQKSSFDAAETRNPFWPIGWKRPNAKDAHSTAPQISPASFALTSVTMGAGTHFAILNGKIMQEGQQFGLQFGKDIFQVTLKSIQDGHVVLTYEDNDIVVPLRRK